MTISPLALSATQAAAPDYAMEQSRRFRAITPDQEQECREKVREAEGKTVQTTLQMMDHHNALVARSQKLYEAKEKKRAVERQSQEQREEHRALLAEMALRNAERSALIQTLRAEAD